VHPRIINQERIQERVRMPSTNLSDFILAMLHQIAGPRYRHCGGRCHHRQVPASSVSTHPSGGNTGARTLGTTTQPPPASAPSHPRVLKRPSSPSPDRPVYRLMEPSDNDVKLRSHRGHPCAIHGWVRAITRLHRRSRSRHGAMRGRRREKKKT
jgi:hypothetical protein